MLIEEFLSPGRLMELLAVVVLTAYFPILTFSFFTFRLTRKKKELESMLKRLDLNASHEVIDRHVAREFTPRDYYLQCYL